MSSPARVKGYACDTPAQQYEDSTTLWVSNPSLTKSHFSVIAGGSEALKHSQVNLSTSQWKMFRKTNIHSCLQETLAAKLTIIL